VLVFVSIGRFQLIALVLAVAAVVILTVEVARHAPSGRRVAPSTGWSRGVVADPRVSVAVETLPPCRWRAIPDRAGGARSGHFIDYGLGTGALMLAVR
jgi:chloramphenicol-sensitive protein RarD